MTPVVRSLLMTAIGCLVMLAVFLVLLSFPLALMILTAVPWFGSRLAHRLRDHHPRAGA